VKRVLITVSDLRRGGGVAHFYERVAPFLPPAAELVVVGKRAGERSVTAAAARLFCDARGLWRLLGQGDVGILHVNPSLDPRSLVRDGAAVLMARLRGKRVVVFVRGWQEPTAAAIDRSWAWLFRAVFADAAAHVVLAAEFREALRRWGCRGPVHVATTAVAQEVLGAVGEEDIRARCRRSGPLTALFLSRVRADKGVFEALEAAWLAQQAGASLRLVVAGDGPALPAAARWVNEHGPHDVRFVGDVRGEAKHALMKECDIYLFPTSHGEGMPATVLEAMAYGMTVIACPVGGLRDFFVDGKHGLVCDDPRPSRLAELLEQASRDAVLRQRLGVAAHRFARDHFSARQAASRLRALYAQVEAAAPGEVQEDSDWFVADGGGEGTAASRAGLGENGEGAAP
jgi:glycosyltransferase involved in cell wall biosynthesis